MKFVRNIVLCNLLHCHYLQIYLETCNWSRLYEFCIERNYLQLFWMVRHEIPCKPNAGCTIQGQITEPDLLYYSKLGGMVVSQAFEY